VEPDINGFENFMAMNLTQSLEELLMVENSRRNTDVVAALVFKRPELFVELVSIYLKNEEPVSRRAVWVVDTVAEKLPDLVLPYLDHICEMLPEFCHDGLKRNTLRILVRSPLPENQLGPLASLCFDWLTSPGESVAVKVYCMEILYRISQTEKDLKKELADSISWRIDEETPGFRAHGIRILKKLSVELKDYPGN
jgi:hypothetical protein